LTLVAIQTVALIRAVLIPQSLRLQAKVTLPSLGWCHQSEECAKSCGRSSVFFLQTGRWNCQYWSAYVPAAITWL